MIRFYAPDVAESLSLPESDSGHAVRVLRMKAGDDIEVVDGQGNLFLCTLVDANPKRAAVIINSVVPLEKTWSGAITLAIAPTKNNDRMEWLVEKLVEIGIDRIVPLRCRRSERKDINIDRLQRVAVAAMKQSLKAALPVIDPIMPFDLFVHSENAPQRFVAYCDPAIERTLLAKAFMPRRDTAILIGPEGDFDPAEIELALKSSWTPVSLGDSRLRTETAALFAVSSCHVISQLGLS